MHADDDPLEQWLHTEGVARYEAFRRNPDNTEPAAQVFADLRKHHEQRVRGEHRLVGRIRRRRNPPR